jgi:hypothetical protein
VVAAAVGALAITAIARDNQKSAGRQRLATAPRSERSGAEELAAR